MALMRVRVEQGTVLLDDVQIEASAKASGFNLRPEEWLRLGIGAADSELPKWVQGDKTLRDLRIRDDSRKPLRGVVSVSLKTWDNRNGFAAADFEPDRRIDYVFVGYPRDHGRGQTVHAELIGTEPVAGVWPSDHFGVAADLRT